MIIEIAPVVDEVAIEQALDRSGRRGVVHTAGGDHSPEDLAGCRVVVMVSVMGQPGVGMGLLRFAASMCSLMMLSLS